MRGCKAFGSITKKSAALVCLSCDGLVAMDLRSTTTRLKAELRTLQDAVWTNQPPPRSVHLGTQRLVRTLRRRCVKACRTHCNAESEVEHSSKGKIGYTHEPKDDHATTSSANELPAASSNDCKLSPNQCNPRTRSFHHWNRAFFHLRAWNLFCNPRTHLSKQITQHHQSNSRSS